MALKRNDKYGLKSENTNGSREPENNDCYIIIMLVLGWIVYAQRLAPFKNPKKLNCNNPLDKILCRPNTFTKKISNESGRQI